ncbi:hypothetical protein SAMN05192534_14416 [Alteribacillus persepolensis]|uniref:Uncharacterized protein n=1 Tax=Alteribacillus persepolensis TaxID=568899 RepID=A0A1G8KB44_9BACI|nr:hypothetical protein SAMN05192534_14416 [Alteribacillus persepolensis]
MGKFPVFFVRRDMNNDRLCQRGKGTGIRVMKLLSVRKGLLPAVFSLWIGGD